MSEQADVVFTVRDRVALVELNRPEKRNALSQDMKTALVDISFEINRDRSIRAAVLVGRGSAFCAGGDLLRMRDRSDKGVSESDRRAEYLTHTAPAIRALESLSKPLITCVNGPAVGAGFGLAMLGDIRVASTAAWFWAPFSLRGVVPDWGMSFTLERVLGYSRALQVLTSNEKVSASDALALGLVASLADGSECLTSAMELAGRIAAGSLASVIATKSMLRAARRSSFGDVLEREAAEVARAQFGADHAEGVSAFLAGRQPEFE